MSSNLRAVERSTSFPPYSWPKLAVPKIIMTERLLLRPVTVEDVTERYVEWLSDPLVNRFFETRQQTAGQIKEYVLQREVGELWAICVFDQIAIFGKANATIHIGNIRLWKPLPRHPLGEISLFIGEKDWRGKGVATEAIKAICRKAVKMGYWKIGASMYEGHWASMFAFRKAGFELEGIRKRHRWFEGKMTDLYEMGLCL